MENLNLDKVKTGNIPLSLSRSKTNSKSPQKNLSVSFDKKMRKSFEENNNIMKIPDLQSSKNSSNFNNNNLDNEISLKNHININIDVMTQKIVSYSKKIKEMEKELKEKNSQIKKLHEKVDKKNEEINKLNEIIIVK